MSPQTVTGHLTGWTLDSSCRTSRAFSHSRRTSSSLSCLQAIRFSIQPSRLGMEGGSKVPPRVCATLPPSAISVSACFIARDHVRLCLRSSFKRRQRGRRGWGAHAVTFKATHQGLVTECRCFRHVDVGEMLKTLPTIFFLYSDLLSRRNGGGGGSVSCGGSVVAVVAVVEVVVFARTAVGEGAGRGGIFRSRGVGSSDLVTD